MVSCLVTWVTSKHVAWFFSDSWVSLYYILLLLFNCYFGNSGYCNLQELSSQATFGKYHIRLAKYFPVEFRYFEIRLPRHHLLLQTCRWGLSFTVRLITTSVHRKYWIGLTVIIQTYRDMLDNLLCHVNMPNVSLGNSVGVNCRPTYGVTPFMWLLVGMIILNTGT